MMEIIFTCDNCNEIYKKEIFELSDIIELPDGWIIKDEGMIDEKLLCQDCFELDEDMI